MKILALDLSLSATGWVLLDTAELDAGRPRMELPHGTIPTPSKHRVGETELAYRQRRLRAFLDVLVPLLDLYTPELLVTEASRAYFGGKRQQNDPRYSPAVQFRAAQGLGWAQGWLDALFWQGAALGVGVRDIVQMDVLTVKRAITGNAQASKAQVRAFLEQVYGWRLAGWSEAESDALAVGLAYLQRDEQDARDARRSARAARH